MTPLAWNNEKGVLLYECVELGCRFWVRTTTTKGKVFEHKGFKTLGPAKRYYARALYASRDVLNITPRTHLKKGRR